MNGKISNGLASLVLLEWGGIFVYFYLSGRIGLFLHPYFQPWVMGAGLLMILTGGVIFFSAPKECGHDHEGHDCCDHDHNAGSGLGRWAKIFVLLLPMAGAAFFSPDRFGEAILQKRKAITSSAELPGSLKFAEPSDSQLVFTSNQPVTMAKKGEAKKTSQSSRSKSGAKAEEVDLMDLLYMANAESERARLEGQMISITGQVARDQVQGIRMGNFSVYQLVIMCCAADARPVSIRINYPNLGPDLKNTTWVKVSGHVHFIPGNHEYIPLLNATEVSEAPVPPDAYFTP